MRNYTKELKKFSNRKLASDLLMYQKMNFNWLLVLIILSGTSTLLRAQSPGERPKLVVGIVVDQLRDEYLYRFYDQFTDEGFRKLLTDGFYYSNMHYSYMPTYTAPGHATIYTGATPNVHGIVGNYWYHRGLESEIYCTLDDSCEIIGGDGRGMSARRLLSTTITDEVKMSTNEKAKVIGVSIKDRGAILPAGHMGDAAYWLSGEATFISSDYYRNSLPDWVIDFNDQNNAAKYIQQAWELEPNVDYGASLPDDSEYESRLGGKDKPVFPYDLTSFVRQGGLNSIRITPFGNNLVIDFAKEAIENEKMGEDDVMDFLAISFSSTDYIGHAMGPRSMEIQDTYIKLDKLIAQFLKYLDREIGEGNYLVFLSSDHGAGEVPGYLADRKFEVTNLDNKDVVSELVRFSIEQYGQNIIKEYSNFNLFLNQELVQSLKLNTSEVLEEILGFLYEQDYVKRVYTVEQILNQSGHDQYLSMIFNGFDPRQCGDLVVLYQPGYMDYKNTGTTHGSAYAYDTHVPLIWYGWKVTPGNCARKTFVRQIAPTLSRLVGVSMPSGTRAETLPEVLETISIR